MESFLDTMFAFLASVVIGAGIGITIGLLVSIGTIDDKVQRMQSESDAKSQFIADHCQVNNEQSTTP
jgi:uncharacterized membrane protein YqgA involved in biofilm formation